jgi:hypothetical protein
MPMRIRKPKMPDMRRTTSRGGDSTVHLLNFAVADSTYANKDSRDSINCSNLSSGEPKKNKVSRNLAYSIKEKGYQGVIGCE